MWWSTDVFVCVTFNIPLHVYGILKTADVIINCMQCQYGGNTQQMNMRHKYAYNQERAKREPRAFFVVHYSSCTV